jgi:predicted membrane metal-binding protein
MATQLHENFRRDDAAPRASERSFGLVFAAVFALIGLWPLLNGDTPRWWSLGIALAFAGLAFLAPRALAPLNRIWMAIGRILHRIVSPVMLGVLYGVAVVPTGLYLRLRGIDPLRLKMDRAATTYWQRRTPPGPPSDSFKNQF